LKDKKTFLKNVIADIKKDSSDVGFAGFLNQKGFKASMDFYFSHEPLANEKYPRKISLREFGKLIEKSIGKIKEFIIGKEIHVYIFPTLSKFIIDKMNGVTGRLIWENVIYIDVFPKKNWKKYFQSTFVHELAHILQKKYSYNMTIGEGVIYDGMAEHFQEKFLGKVKNPWTHVLTEKEAKQRLSEIKPILKRKDLRLYREVFYGTGRYPLWMGYSLGYYIIQEYLKKHKIAWDEFLRISPQQVLKEIRL
jgi:uncharacterized protein YjaZ